jgi:hypothetical protein
VRIFPDAESGLRLVRALAVEIPEKRFGPTRYLNMEHLKEHKKAALRALAAGRRPGVGGAARHGGSAPATPTITRIGRPVVI